MEIKELDVIRSKDGREGTVLEIFDQGAMLYVEFPAPADAEDLYVSEFLPADQVEEVTYRAQGG